MTNDAQHHWRLRERFIVEVHPAAVRRPSCWRTSVTSGHHRGGLIYPHASPPNNDFIRSRSRQNGISRVRIFKNNQIRQVRSGVVVRILRKLFEVPGSIPFGFYFFFSQIFRFRVRIPPRTYQPSIIFYKFWLDAQTPSP